MSKKPLVPYAGRERSTGNPSSGLPRIPTGGKGKPRPDHWKKINRRKHDVANK